MLGWLSTTLMPMWGSVSNVEECPCGAGLLRWRDTQVGQGHEMEGCPGRLMLGGRDEPMSGSTARWKGTWAGRSCGKGGSQEGLWCEMEGAHTEQSAEVAGVPIPRSR